MKLLRTLSVLACIAGFSFVSTVPAQAINYHNGFVLFHNETPYAVEVNYLNATGEGFCFSLDDISKRAGLVGPALKAAAAECRAGNRYNLKIAPGGAIADDRCCTVAGQTYTYTLGNQKITAQPRVCAGNGAIYGFVRVRITLHGILTDNEHCP